MPPASEEEEVFFLSGHKKQVAAGEEEDTLSTSGADIIGSLHVPLLFLPRASFLSFLPSVIEK